MKVVLVKPRGFCAGVARAVEIVEAALEMYGPPVFVRHEIVHNTHVVERLRARGAVFVDELSAVEPGVPVILSAHGVARSVREEAARRGLHVIDATCPLVAKVHQAVLRARRRGDDVIVVGHAGHPEIVGTLGQVESGVWLVTSVRDVATLSVSDPDHVSFVTQTTLSVDDCAEIVQALRRRFPRITGPRTDDICYATQNRQHAVKVLAGLVERLVVVGGVHSSNSHRLREIGEHCGIPAVLVEGADGLDLGWLAGVSRLGLTAGASTPESVVQQTVGFLRDHGATEIEELAVTDERVEFSAPRELAGAFGGASMSSR
jgi:4-hydroxy-3-methylbut-2-enyl diphosphate reductase